jgi:4-amino-4-deoxy-L-arabinose transferase-like glycosyltransferase
VITLSSGMKSGPIRVLDQVRVGVAVHAGTVMFILMGLALAYWLWIGLVWRSFHFDDGTSILAIQGIMEHGYPLLPSGFIYYRGYAPNYMSAATSLAFGLNDFALILPSLLMGIGSLWLVYLFARDVMKRPWMGVAAAALLLVLQFHSSLTTSPRMYMALEFFAVLSSYWAWRGYVRGEGKYQWLTILALMGAVLTHVQAGALLVAVPLAVTVTRWIQGEGRPRINHLLPLSGLVLLFTSLYMLYFYSLPADQPQIAMHSGLLVDNSGIHFDALNLLGHSLALERLVPLGALLSPLITLLVFKAYRDRHIEANQGTVYAFLFFFICGLLTMSLIKTLAPRFWVVALPVYAILLCTSIGYAVTWFTGKNIHWGPSFTTRLRSAFLPATVAGFVAAIFLVTLLALGPAEYLAMVKDGYGVPCSQGTCSGTIKSQYSELKGVIAEDEVIISSNPLITSYYLGRVDGWFRERILPTGYSSFESPTDEYFGIQLIDSQEELNSLRDGDKRVWLILDYKADFFSSIESRALIESSFTVYGESDLMAVYVNSRDVVRQ